MISTSKTFEEFYDKLVRYARFEITNKGLNIDSEDLVNDTYIKIIESGLDFDLSTAKKLISGQSYKCREHAKTETSFSSKPSSFKDLSGDKQCKCCNKVKHISEFPVWRKQAYVLAMPKCKECMKPVFARSWRKTNKKYKEKNIDNITDVYVKHLLKLRGKPCKEDDIQRKKLELTLRRSKLKSGEIKAGVKKVEIKPQYADISSAHFLKQCEAARNIINSIRKVA